MRVFLELKGNYLYVYNYLIVTEKGGGGGRILLKLFYNFYFTGLIRVHIKWHPSKFTWIVLILEQFTEVIKASTKTDWFPMKNTGRGPECLSYNINTKYLSVPQTKHKEEQQQKNVTEGWDGFPLSFFIR